MTSNQVNVTMEKAEYGEKQRNQFAVYSLIFIAKLIERELKKMKRLKKIATFVPATAMVVPPVDSPVDSEDPKE